MGVLAVSLRILTEKRQGGGETRKRLRPTRRVSASYKHDAVVLTTARIFGALKSPRGDNGFTKYRVHRILFPSSASLRSLSMPRAPG